jgi:hypothetical protein
MNEQSLEDKLFSSDLYKQSQSKFLLQGLEGAVDHFMLELSNAKFKEGKGTECLIYLKTAIAHRLLSDLKAGLINGDFEQQDVQNLITKVNDE